MNRRDFLITGLSGLITTTASLSGYAAGSQNTSAKSGSSLGSAEDLFSPFSSLSTALNGKRSMFFGIKTEDRFENLGNGNSGTRLKRLPRDPKTLYLAGGVSGQEEPHSFFLTFEITNNRILCSVNDQGLLQHPCIYSRLVPAERRGSSFMAEELLGGSPWGFGLGEKGRQPVRLPMTHSCTVELLATLFPIYGYQHGDIEVRLLVFAPQLGGPNAHNPQAILAVAQLRNLGKTHWDGSLFAPNIHDLVKVNFSNGLATPAESPHPRFTEHPVPIKPGYEAVLCLDGTTWNPDCPEIRVALQSGQERIFCFGLLLGRSPDDLHKTGQHLQQHSVLDWLNETVQGRTMRYGRLDIPSHPYYAESYVRLFESASSAILYSVDDHQFGGGPSGYADFALALFEPDLLRPMVVSKAGFLRRPKGQPAWNGLNDSLANSMGNLCAMALYYRMTGDRITFQENPGLLEFAQEMLSDILATRKGTPYLFPSKRIWDGPARGDYHTGSNIMVWLAFSGMAQVARLAYDRPALSDEWMSIARKIREDIFRHCVGDSPSGRRFFEGANANGTFVPGHDSEEAFTTLAPFFGFCEADEPALINHARMAFTPDNPLYEPAVDGIWWEARGTTWAGTSMPGQLAMLAAIKNEKDILTRLEQFRGLTDLDGSVWWWPYLYPCNDREKVRRREWPSDCSKCGYAAAIYLCQFVHNILGIQVDVAARRIALRPFGPWPEFDWKNARLGRATFNITYKQEAGRISASITNQTIDVYEGVIELTLPQGAGVISHNNDGTSATRRFERHAIRKSAFIEPSKMMTLEIAYAL